MSSLISDNISFTNASTTTSPFSLEANINDIKMFYALPIEGLTNIDQNMGESIQR
jgi:hypothetical protein